MKIAYSDCGSNADCNVVIMSGENELTGFYGLVK